MLLVLLSIGCRYGYGNRKGFDDDVYGYGYRCRIGGDDL